MKTIKQESINRTPVLETNEEILETFHGRLNRIDPDEGFIATLTDDKGREALAVFKPEVVAGICALQAGDHFLYRVLSKDGITRSEIVPVPSKSYSDGEWQSLVADIDELTQDFDYGDDY